MNEPVTVYRGTCLGMVNSAEIVKVVNSSERVNRVNRIEVCDKVFPEHLVDLYNRSISDLPEAFHKPVSDLLCNNSEVFAKNDQDLGCTQVIKHHIDTGLEAPIKQPPRRFPAQHEQEIERQINELPQNGLIQPGNGPWGSPIVLVKKKDGYIRMCVDYRRLNSKTVKDAYSLPRIDDTLDSLANAKLFATLDLASGYHLVENTPQAKFKVP